MSKTTKAKANSNNKIRCAFCGKPFVPKTANALYCGGKCKAAAKNALKRLHRKLVKESFEELPKTASKIASVQKVKLPKPPLKSVPPEEKDSYEAQRERFMLVGFAATLLVKTLLDSCKNDKSEPKHIRIKVTKGGSL